jgi:hypothetical protein
MGLLLIELGQAEEVLKPCTPQMHAQQTSSANNSLSCTQLMLMSCSKTFDGSNARDNDKLVSHSAVNEALQCKILGESPLRSIVCPILSGDENYLCGVILHYEPKLISLQSPWPSYSGKYIDIYIPIMLTMNPSTHLSCFMHALPGHLLCCH